MRLSTRLGLVLTCLSVTVLGTTLALLVVSERRHLVASQHAAQAQAIERWARVCAESILDDDEILRLTYLKTFLESSEPGSIAYAALVDSRQRVVMHSDFLRGDFKRKGRPESEALTRDSGTSIASAPVLAGERRLGTAVIAYDQRVQDALLKRVLRESLERIAAVAMAGVGVSLLLAAGLGRTLTRPIQRMRSAAEAIGSGDLKTRVKAERSDELGDLARSLNAMAAKLGELDELKESFLSQITHDLRNPLGAAMAYNEMMQLGTLGPVSAEQANALGVSLRSQRYLADLIDDILDLTKLKAGKMVFEKRPVDLSQIAKSAAEVMQGKAAEYNVKVESSIPAGTSVLADSQAIRRVFVNLLSNALKFTPSGGQVQFVAQSQKQGEVIVGVRDTGIGIPADKIATLFREFSQVCETRNKVREAKGTGLGLVICKMIVEGHGGRIWIESQYTKGTTFWLTLPKG